MAAACAGRCHIAGKVKRLEARQTRSEGNSSAHLIEPKAVSVGEYWVDTSFNIGQGTYGTVKRGTHKTTGDHVSRPVLFAPSLSLSQLFLSPFSLCRSP